MEIGGGTPLFATWTSEFDCGYETNWWYCIKDTPFDSNLLKSKRRYEINKGIKYFDVKKIMPSEYFEEILSIIMKAVDSYPEKYRPTIDKNIYRKNIKNWDWYFGQFYGAFLKETGQLCGFIANFVHETYIDFAQLKVDPGYEKYAINAALVNYMLLDNADFLTKGKYICDGQRNLLHETSFQDYLEKYFGFRKAYCKKHVIYRRGFNFLVRLLYPFKKILMKFDKYQYVHSLLSILKLEEISR